MSTVEAVANTWLGTPYVHGGSLRGIGVDCVHLVEEVLRGAGLLPAVDCGAYPRDWFVHRDDERLLAGVRERCDPVEGEWQAGDILLFRFGRCQAHAGVYLGDGKMIHCTREDGVTISFPESARWYDRLCGAWRPRGRV